LLALALVNDPVLLFLDEPTTGLDPQARHNFWELVRNIKARGKTVILTTHYMEEAYLLCDRIIIMDHGHIIAKGRPAALLEQHFRGVVLQLPYEDFHPVRDSFAACYRHTGELVEITITDVNTAIATLLNHGISLARLQIRARTLEDLFLELTGRELRA
ncbi:MAG: ABC transporter ATP-binding protein, partial [Gammaproteobacteria bacterium]|nr:ABC transporter ATP-binding protein [Gammaproteobacteria bacterium]